MKLLSSLLLTVLVLFVGCSKEISNEEKLLFKKNGIDIEIASHLKSSYQEASQMLSMNADYDEVAVKGVALKIKANAGRKALIKIRSQLEGSESQAYLMEDNFGYSQDIIAVVPTTDDIDYLKIIRTDGVNFDLSAEDVLKKYKEWDATYTLKLVGAGRDWLEAEVEGTSINWEDFSKKVFKFCPDVVDQGTGTLQALEVEMKSRKVLCLWWD